MERLELSEAQVEVTSDCEATARARARACATNFSPLTSSNVVANTRGAQNPSSALTLRRTYDGSAEMMHDGTFTADSRTVLVCVSVLV